MRIAHIVPVANHTPWFADICAETARQGHDVVAIIHSAPGNLSERLTRLGIRHYRVPMHFAEDLDRARPLFYLLRLPLAALRVARILRRERIDVVHSHIFVANVVARLAKPFTSTLSVSRLASDGLGSIARTRPSGPTASASSMV